MLRKDKARKRVLKYHEEKLQILGRRGLYFIHFTYVLFKKKKKAKEAKSNNIQGKIIPSKKPATAETLTGGMPRPPEEHKAEKCCWRGSEVREAKAGGSYMVLGIMALPF